MQFFLSLTVLLFSWLIFSCIDKPSSPFGSLVRFSHKLSLVKHRHGHPYVTEPHTVRRSRLRHRRRFNYNHRIEQVKRGHKSRRHPHASRREMNRSRFEGTKRHHRIAPKHRRNKETRQRASKIVARLRTLHLRRMEALNPRICDCSKFHTARRVLCYRYHGEHGKCNAYSCSSMYLCIAKRARSGGLKCRRRFVKNRVIPIGGGGCRTSYMPIFEYVPIHDTHHSAHSPHYRHRRTNKKQ